jgi:hypothetical protein
MMMKENKFFSVVVDVDVDLFVQQRMDLVGDVVQVDKGKMMRTIHHLLVYLVD